MIRFGHNGAGNGRQTRAFGLLFYRSPAMVAEGDGA